MRKINTLAVIAATLAATGTAAVIAAASSAEPKPQPPVQLAQLRSELPSLTTGAKVAADSAVVRATPIAPEDDPVVDISTVRQARGVNGPSVVVASTRDGNGACVGSDGVLACAPRSALHDLGATYGLAVDPDEGIKLVALTLKRDGVITIIDADGTRNPLQATDGVISVQLDSRPTALEFTKPNGEIKTITTELPRVQ